MERHSQELRRLRECFDSQPGRDAVIRAKVPAGAREVNALIDLLKSRAAHPQSIGYLRRFGDLSLRERSMVTTLLELVAIELQHAYDHDKITRRIKREATRERRQVMTLAVAN